MFRKKSKTTLVLSSITSFCCMHLQYLNSDPQEIIHDDIQNRRFQGVPKENFKGDPQGNTNVHSLYFLHSFIKS